MSGLLLKILLYGLQASVGLGLMWVTKFTRPIDRRDLEAYREEFKSGPGKRMLEDLIDNSSKYFPVTPVIFGFGLMATVYGVLMLLHLAFSTPE